MCARRWRRHLLLSSTCRHLRKASLSSVDRPEDQDAQTPLIVPPATEQHLPPNFFLASLKLPTGNKLNVLLLTVPVAICAQFLSWGDVAVFA